MTPPHLFKPQGCRVHQRKAVLAAEADNWRILPGQKYRKCKGIYDGEFFTYRARIDMDSVTYDLDMWED